MWWQTILSRLTANGWTVAGECQDLTVIVRGDRQRWLNFRCKATATHCRQADRWEFGMSAHDVARYQRLMQRGHDLWSVIHEKGSGTTYVAPMREVFNTSRLYTGDKLDQGGTVFVDRAAYPHQVNAVAETETPPGRVVVTPAAFV